MDTLRFITCGSVDDGNPLIGRLLYESKVILDDQLTTLESDSRKFGTQGGGLDFALLVDGLAAEREQGITIDVAYRYFTTTRTFYRRLTHRTMSNTPAIWQLARRPLDWRSS